MVLIGIYFGKETMRGQLLPHFLWRSCLYYLRPWIGAF
jgi:hypothetical protein